MFSGEQVCWDVMVLLVGYHQAVLAPTRLDDSCFHGQWRYDLDSGGQKEEVILQRLTDAPKVAEAAEAFVGYYYLEGQQCEGTKL